MKVHYAYKLYEGRYFTLLINIENTFKEKKKKKRKSSSTILYDGKGTSFFFLLQIVSRKLLILELRYLTCTLSDWGETKVSLDLYGSMVGNGKSVNTKDIC